MEIFQTTTGWFLPIWKEKNKEFKAYTIMEGLNKVFENVFTKS